VSGREVVKRRRPIAAQKASPRDIWRQAEAQARRTALEDRFAAQVHACHLPKPEREFTFHPTRKWRFDFAWPEHKVAAEIDGGTMGPVRGRHVSPEGFERDAEKFNVAQAEGWRVFRYTSRMVRTGSAIIHLARELERAAFGYDPRSLT